MMKNKILISVALISLIEATIMCYNIKSIYAEVNSSKLNKEELMDSYGSRELIKVNFYRWDRNTEQKGEFIGTAELEDGKLTFDVKDKRLEKMLKGDFHTMITVEEDGKPINKFVTYKVGAIEHIQSVIEHCKDISCIAEIIEK